MTVEGPPLEPLLRRAAECPPGLVEARAAPDADAVLALVHDVLEDAAEAAPRAEALASLQRAIAPDSGHRRLVALAAWVLGGGTLRRIPLEAALFYLAEELADRAPTLDAATVVTDHDRRGELVRSMLRALGLHPSGETEEQAEDLLASVDSRAKRGVLARARDRLRRIRKIRAEMRKKADEEAAARMTGE